MWKAFQHWKGLVEVHDPITATMAAATVVGGGLSAAGTIMGGNAAKDAGQRAQQAAEFRAQQEEQAAQQSRAAAQRVSLDKQHEGKLLQSKLQARAAASGGGADDPTVVNLASGIAGRTEYESLMSMFTGEDKARGLEDQAIASRLSGEAAAAEGRAKQKASYFSAAGTLIGSAGSAYGTYNKVPTKYGAGYG